ncbi:MAG: DUF262 domain-containing protein [Muribaculum sp.]|nr:DUF262 domain-containing protein [Muribaculum sp.]
MVDNTLKVKAVADIKGRFRIPSYQRGYRWERLNVEQLLNDIVESNENAPYYLQPIVVSRAPEEVKSLPEEEQYDYDLIDGQQRLTTIYLIIKAFDAIKNTNIASLAEKLAKGDITQEEFTLQAALVGNFAQIDTSDKYKISYQTRKSTKKFLSLIGTLSPTNEPAPNGDSLLISESPDHVYMWQAFASIIDWLKRAGAGKIERLVNSLLNTGKYPANMTRIIWYELPDSVKDWKKFTELNIGKIPLTNSELIKALFLKSKTKFSTQVNPDADEYDKQTIVAQWDQTERELSDPEFWGFLTSASPEQYPTRIDLLFDLFSQKASSGSRDKLYTFNKFAEWFESNKKSGKEKWDEIMLQYQRLRDWYFDTKMYHRLGYLISINYPANALERVFRYAHPNVKGRGYRSTKRVREMIDHLVKMSIRIPSDGKFENVKSFRDLKYNAHEDPNKFDGSHQYLIKCYLTLYNIMVTEAASSELRYPFHKHNAVGGGWSLEHIHAQNSQTLNKAVLWNDWSINHRQTVKSLLDTFDPKSEEHANASALLTRMNDFIADPNKDRREFNFIAQDFVALLESLPGARGLYQDEMGNMALLGKYDNSTLNNSTFDVKRRRVVEDLSKGFMPIGTERVFLKAISGVKKGIDENGNTEDVRYTCDIDHMYFWSKLDREAYMDDMEQKLAKYLEQ